MGLGLRASGNKSTFLFFCIDIENMDYGRVWVMGTSQPTLENKWQYIENNLYNKQYLLFITKIRSVVMS